MSLTRTRCLLRFQTGCVDDALCAFALLQNEARELRLCHAHPLGTMLFWPGSDSWWSHPVRAVCLNGYQPGQAGWAPSCRSVPGNRAGDDVGYRFARFSGQVYRFDSRLKIEVLT